MFFLCHHWNSCYMWPPCWHVPFCPLFHRWGTSPLWLTHRSLRTSGSDKVFCSSVCYCASVSNIVGMGDWGLWNWYHDIKVYHSVWLTRMCVIVSLPTQDSAQNCESLLRCFFHPTHGPTHCPGQVAFQGLVSLPSVCNSTIAAFVKASFCSLWN